MAVARPPQPPVPHFLEQQPAPAPSGFLVALAAAGLFVLSTLGSIVNGMANRWRGVVIAHLFFLTLWMAIQVFFFATGAYWCLPSNGSAAVEWFSKYFTHIARCGPVPQTLPAFQGSTAVAAPAAGPALPRPPGTMAVPAAPRAPASPPSPAVPPPSAAAPAAPAYGAAPGWSARTVQNCWRNRSVDGGGCYDNMYPRRATAPTPAPPPIIRYRYPEPPPLHPCLRPYDCWPDDYWRDDDL
jgi:hypothetical protein